MATEDKLAGKLMVDKELHLEKAALPISVRPEHAANAKSYEKGMTMRRISDTPEDIFAFPCDGTWLIYETIFEKFVVIILHI